MILGVDPGLTNTGWAFLREGGPAWRYADAGEIVTDKEATPQEQLDELHGLLGDVLMKVMGCPLVDLGLTRRGVFQVVIEQQPLASGSGWGQVAASKANLAAGSLYGLLRPFAALLHYPTASRWQAALGIPKPPKGLTSHQRQKHSTEAARACLLAIAGHGGQLPPSSVMDSPHAVDAALLAAYGRQIGP